MCDIDVEFLGKFEFDGSRAIRGQDREVEEGKRGNMEEYDYRRITNLEPSKWVKFLVIYKNVPVPLWFGIENDTNTIRDGLEMSGGALDKARKGTDKNK